MGLKTLFRSFFLGIVGAVFFVLWVIFAVVLELSGQLVEEPEN